MRPLNRSSVLQRFECDNTVKIHKLWTPISTWDCHICIWYDTVCNWIKWVTRGIIIALKRRANGLFFKITMDSLCSLPFWGLHGSTIDYLPILVHVVWAACWVIAMLLPLLQLVPMQLTSWSIDCQLWFGNSLVLRPRPAFRCYQYGKAGKGLVSFLTWVTSG